MLCPIVVWDGFGEAIAFLIGYYKVAQEIGSEFDPQNSPRMQFNSIGSSSKHDSDGGKTGSLSNSDSDGGKTESLSNNDSDGGKTESLSNSDGDGYENVT